MSNGTNHHDKFMVGMKIRLQGTLWRTRILQGDLWIPEIYAAHWAWEEAVKQERYEDAIRIYEEMVKHEQWHKPP